MWYLLRNCHFLYQEEDQKQPVQTLYLCGELPAIERSAELPAAVKSAELLDQHKERMELANSEIIELF